VPKEERGPSGGESPWCEGEEGSTMTSPRTPTILVADDNREHCEVLGKVLARAGYQVAVAADGQEALQVLRERPFDLVFADLRMPRLSGLDLLRNIRSMGPEVPVVIVTAFGDWVTYADAIESGAVDYLSKPVRREDLLLTARKALGRRGIRAPSPVYSRRARE
jgi:DNA-binding NtrC family response regulator